MKRVSKVLLVTLCSAVPFQSLGAQTATLEERVAQLERLVGELRAVHGLPAERIEELPEILRGNEQVRWGYPGGECTILVKEYYVICYDDANRVPDWVTYHLSRENLAGEAPRTNDFRADADLPSGERAELVDYRHSGYDRGHMAPAAAFKRSSTAMSETFLLSNVAPQRPNLNRHIWRRLEQEVRSLASAHGSIWVFTGTLFLDQAGNPIDPVAYIGPNRVAVPTHFYKVILCEHTTGTVELFAFVMQNPLQPLAGRPRDYLVSVDEVESLTGLDFFAVLPDWDEERLEEMVATNWPIR
jgi:endonuclease G